MPYLPTEATEPQHGWKFAKVTYLYLPASAVNQQKAALFCTVHYESGSDAPLAGRIAGLLALAHQTLVQKTGRDAENGTAPFDVWLCAGGQSGGEQWRNPICTCTAMETPRSSIEWIREVVHEYSHLALPAHRRVRRPGILGERLSRRAAYWCAGFSGQPNGPAEVALSGATSAAPQTLTAF